MTIQGEPTENDLRQAGVKTDTISVCKNYALLMKKRIYMTTITIVGFMISFMVNVNIGHQDISTSAVRSDDNYSINTSALVPLTDTIPSTIPSAADTELQSMSQRIFELTNAERAKAGVKTLLYSKELENCAHIRSGEIVTCWSHTRPNGQLWYTVTPEIMFGENLAKGYKTPEDTVNAWMNSPGHRANILDNSFTYVGIGVYKHNGYYYVAQEFCY